MTRTTPLDGLRICLVFPNVALERTAALAQNVHALGAIQPLSLLYVAGILEEAGASVSFIDATARGLSLEETSGFIEAFRPDVVGWTLATLDFSFSLDWIRTIRQHVDVPVLVGGIHLSHYPRETLTHIAIDERGQASDWATPHSIRKTAPATPPNSSETEGACSCEDATALGLLPLLLVPCRRRRRNQGSLA